MTIMIPAWVDGTLTPVEKLDAHLRGLRHKAVSVFVIHEGAVLIQRRAMGKYHTPGLWANTCCTHPEWDESPKTCAVRRLEEELGIQGIDPDYRDRVEYRADVGDGLIEHELVDVFVAHVKEKPSIRMNPEEVMQIDWVPYRELLDRICAQPSDYTPWLRIYLEEFAERIFQADFA